MPSTWLGQPRGLATLFFTEMWERFSYYGMRAILVLAMVASVESGGLGLDDRTATAVYGLYTAAVYLLAVPGGWVADRLIGQQQAIWYGGIVITLGHFTMALPTVPTFYVGLVLIVIGTGLLKPNISTLVGELYPEGGARRDAGFSLFYMGINLGAFLGPLVCGWLGERVNWHAGFAAAGVCMLLGLVQFRLGGRHLATAGQHPAPVALASRRRDVALVWLGLSGLLAAVLAALGGWWVIDPVRLAGHAVGVIIAAAAAFFVGVILFAGLDRAEQRRVGVIAVFFLAAAVFWSGFEQAGSSFTLFAERYTDRDVFGWVMPASWLQSVNPLFIILFAPVFAALWVRLAQRNLSPSTPVKFALGLLQLAAGFAVLGVASVYVVRGEQVLPTWLILTYLLHTTGELCLSPVGLSAVTQLAPRRLVGQMMGTWFMGAALGNLIGGLIAGHFGDEALADLPHRFAIIVLVVGSAGLLMLLLSRPITRLSRPPATEP